MIALVVSWADPFTGTAGISAAVLGLMLVVVVVEAVINFGRRAASSGTDGEGSE